MGQGGEAGAEMGLGGAVELAGGEQGQQAVVDREAVRVAQGRGQLRQQRGLALGLPAGGQARLVEAGPVVGRAVRALAQGLALVGQGRAAEQGVVAAAAQRVDQGLLAKCHRKSRRS